MYQIGGCESQSLASFFQIKVQHGMILEECHHLQPETVCHEQKFIKELRISEWRLEYSPH